MNYISLDTHLCGGAVGSRYVEHPDAISQADARLLRSTLTPTLTLTLTLTCAVGQSHSQPGGGASTARRRMSDWRPSRAGSVRRSHSA